MTKPSTKPTQEQADRIRDQKEADARRDDPVREASEESFPACDPPSWTPVTGPGTPQRDKPKGNC